MGSSLRTLTAVGVLFTFTFAGCGETRPELGGPCDVTCDCDATDAPLRCPGEWVCNPENTCEYTCKTPCSQPPFTCAADEQCNGTFCSERSACGE